MPTSAPVYRVLLVGIGPYKGAKFGPLSGDKDVRMLADVLQARWQVPEGSIRILDKPENTTKAAIVAAIREHLVEPAARGDVIYFAFAGHGTQVPDPRKPTGLSQAIVPIDARFLPGGDIDPSSLLTGPEIGRLFDGLKAKGVTNVTLSFDSCHSGSVTRGACRVRGVANPAAERVLAGQAASPMPVEDISQEPGFKGMVCLSAARADQKAWENSKGGFMTQALVDALNSNRPGGTYATLFRHLQVRMAASEIPNRQDPQIEGDASRVVFGDTYVFERPSMPVFLESEELWLRAGAVLGVETGFVVGLYKPSTEDLTGKPDWTATVERAGATRSLLRLSRESLKTLKRGLLDVNGAKAVISDGSADGHLRVNLAAIEGNSRAPAILEALAKVPVLDLAPQGDYDAAVIPPGGAGGAPAWEVQDSAGRTLVSVSGSGGDPELVAKIEQALRVQARKRAVARLRPSESPRVAVELELVRAKMVGGAVSELGAVLPPGAELDADDRFAIRVRAIAPPKSPMPYLTLLFVAPDATDRGQHVGQLWPVPSARLSELRRIQVDGQWRYLGRNLDLVDGRDLKQLFAAYVSADEDGLGPELFKLIATDEVVDFSSVVDSRGAQSRLGRLLQSYNGNAPIARSGGEPKANPSEWSIAEAILVVKGKAKAAR